MSNKDVLDKGFTKGLQMIRAHIEECLRSVIADILKQVAVNREFVGFTGNTQTSYAAGLYFDGRLIDVITQDNWTEPTRRRKLKEGEVVYLTNPYDGDARVAVGHIDTDGGHGRATSLEFLWAYPARKGYITIVVTTGTEYSEYIETVGHADVLTKTYNDATDILQKNFKPMKE